jgi:hypothetical protein
MDFSNVKFADEDGASISAVVDGKTRFVPATPGDRFYDELVRQGITPDPYVAPVEDPYPALNRIQFMAMVEILGKTSAIETAIDQISDTTQRAVAKAKFYHSSKYDRDDPLFETLRKGVGMSNEDINNAWAVAKTI